MSSRLLGLAVLAAAGLSAPACAAGDDDTATPRRSEPAVTELHAPDPTFADGTLAAAQDVSYVIDGDTIEMTDGSTVRLIGIDTPERGDCGYDTAAWGLRDMIADRPVVLSHPEGVDETDQYGRLLRYVETFEGLDPGLELIRGGAAIARYDSRDGYGSHPREGAYITADLEARDACDIPRSPSSTERPAADHDSYASCEEARSAGAAPLYTGDSGYSPELDRDGDGMACEA
jgi:endonuclease YncB( thermonuclease family)